MQCRYCGMENTGSGRTCISCNKPMQDGNPRMKVARAGSMPVSHKADFASLAAPVFGASNPIFRSSTAVKENRLTGSASTASRKTQASGLRTPPMPGQRGAGASDSVLERRRSEPRLEGRESAFIESSEDELQRQYAFYNRFNTPPPRSRPSIVYVIAVFAIGAVVGVIGAWWGGQSSGEALENDIPHALQNYGTRGVHSAAAKGIALGELPYDGVPTDPGEQVHQVRRSGINPEERPYAESVSSSHVTQPAGPAELPSEVRQEGKSRQRAADGKPVRSASAAGIKKAGTTRASQKRRSTHRRAAKDREIDRIKQQAADEIKKKTDSSHSVKQQADSSAHRAARRQEAPTVIDKSTRTRALLASCERAENFFLREKCKWRLCGGRWGEHGCPSYQTQASSY